MQIHDAWPPLVRRQVVAVIVRALQVLAILVLEHQISATTRKAVIQHEMHRTQLFFVVVGARWPDESIDERVVARFHLRVDAIFRHGALGNYFADTRRGRQNLHHAVQIVAIVVRVHLEIDCGIHTVSNGYNLGAPEKRVWVSKANEKRGEKCASLELGEELSSPERRKKKEQVQRLRK